METGTTITHDDRAELLARAPLLAGVGPEGIAPSRDASSRSSSRRITSSLDRARSAPDSSLIASGSVRVVRDGQTIARIGPGDFFGELSVLDGQPRVAQVIADEPTVCLALASWDFEAVVKEQPARRAGHPAWARRPAPRD